MLHQTRWRTVDYYTLRCQANLRLIEQLDLIGQTSEFARVFGIEFYDVLNRGSQVISVHIAPTPSHPPPRLCFFGIEFYDDLSRSSCSPLNLC